MRVKITIAYDGTNYYGYQKQPNKKTIQDEFEKALQVITKEPTLTVGSGRTDGHVHAKGQVLHFDTEIKMNERQWLLALNSHLPKDIRALKAEFVSDDFHARFSAVNKEYRYYIKLGEFDLFYYNYTLNIKSLDIESMKKGIKYFLGEHDFACFASYVENKPTVRTITKAEINVVGEIVEIIFEGNGFLKYMVRTMVGTLIEIGLNRKKPEDIVSIFESNDRKKAGKTALPNGLYLIRVDY